MLAGIGNAITTRLFLHREEWASDVASALERMRNATTTPLSIHVLAWFSYLVVAILLVFLHGVSLLITTVPFIFLLSALRPLKKVHWDETRNLCAMALSFSSFAFIWTLSPWDSASTSPWVYVHPIGLIMLMLNSFIALIVSGFSAQFMAREAGEARYHRWLLLTLSAATTVLISNHLLIFLGGWVGISLGLHRLLMFYPQRPRAALAAHKKFLFARLSEFSLFMAFCFLRHAHGTWFFNEIFSQLDEGAFTWQHHVAAFFIAITAMIKCAQMPLHGWLMQVVEAPTPISALLHAGIINMGGFLLILFAPLFAEAISARWLLLIVAGVSTVVSSLIMMTRISIKVKLAWSTCAQMGLMLLECALGLYQLALLHLLAHSFYKAHAFLSAGSAVESDIMRRMTLSPPPTSVQWLVAMVCSAIMTVSWCLVFHGFSGYSTWLLVAFALSLVILENRTPDVVRPSREAFISCFKILCLYSILKTVMGYWAPETNDLGERANQWTSFLFMVLAIGYVLIRIAPDHPLVKRLQVVLFAGLYLDEWATRLTLRIWPASMPTIHEQRYKSLRGIES